VSNIYTTIEKHARKYIPSFIAPLAKKIIAYPRYYAQIKKCRAEYTIYKDKYGQHVLFIAGLPKSGTTWFEKMLGSLPGFSDVMIPEAISYEQTFYQSHTFEFPLQLFSRFNKALVVLKLHAHGSLHNFQILENNNIRYVVMYRDLRDVAVSHVFYVQRTAYHPEHSIYKNLNLKEGLLHFAHTLLPEFIKWVDSWHQYAGSSLCYILKYEDLSANPFIKMTEVINHYRLNISGEELHDIIAKNSFENLSGGRRKGSPDSASFFRSGTSGDWKNHFDDELTTLYNTILKAFLFKYGYPE
jgi:hypothetical protein